MKESRGKGRPARIDKAQVVEAALAVGLGNLTMKAVAARLGVGTAALYYHVRDRDELMSLVAVTLIAKADLPEAIGPETWRAVLRRTAHGLRAKFRAADGLAEYAFCDPSMPDEILKLHEVGTAGLVAAGFTPRTAWLALRSMVDFVEASVFREQKHPVATETALAARIEAMGPPLFPTLCQAFAQAAPAPIDEMFDYGLERLLDGIEEDRR
jgi:AcrR family transcriptional regulator